MSYYRYTKRDEHYTGRDRKLWELENKIEDGLLIELPFKIGDKVYLIFALEIHESEIDGFEILATNEKPIISVFAGDMYNPLKDYNITWFTDKAKAEERLKELKNADID